MKLIVQPDAGTAPIIKAIRRAKKSLEVVIFRFDQGEIERALVEAAERGVFVHALIAFTNRGGEKKLRDLEMRLLEKGVTVARTAADLSRYHAKMMLVDRKELFVLAYNFTRLDTERSRSFAIATKNAELVQEAAHLFECDTKRQSYKPHSERFIVSPANARQRLAAFIKSAKRELLIYDIKLSDHAMIRLLEERLRMGVKVKIIGQVDHNQRFSVRALKGLRLHARAIVRDRQHAFVGSQSLRKSELDSRREIGIIVRGDKVVEPLIATFQSDWKGAPAMKPEPKRKADNAVNGSAKKVAKAVSKEIPVQPVVDQVVKALRQQARIRAPKTEVQEAVTPGLKKAVKKAAKELVENAAEGG